MHLSRKLVFSASLVTLLAGSLLHEVDAAACGGCFALPSENTEISSERMIISISQTQSTLYDEIQYSGNPSSFAWVLPIAGPVTVGLSSDALFAEIDQLTAVSVTAPPVTCGCPPPVGFSTGSFSAGSSGAGGGSGGVTVISQTVVGPYQTVQLSSTNPTALTDWLTMNGYDIPADTKPVIAAYVKDGFDFLALKLLPGMGVSSMQPVRVTTPGASPSLPLRMVAVGAGVTVPITLFVVGEGRYVPTNFPSFILDPTKLVWDFDSESSNYATLRQQAFNGVPNAWQVESATPQSAIQITDDIGYLAQVDPTDSGYADSMGNGAPMAAMADLDTLFTGINMSSLWITRMFAEMPRTALTKDLTVGASTDQSQVPTQLTASKYVNCAGCPGGNGGGSVSTTGAGAGGAGGAGGKAASTGTGSAQPSGGMGCSVSGAASTPFALGAMGALALAAARRRRRS